MSTILRIFSNVNYTKLFLASVASQMGGIIGLTGFTFYLLDRYSNQPVYATITELMFSLPALAVFLLVGVFADRLDRQRIAMYCDWICAGLSLLLLLSLSTGFMPLVFSLLFMRSAVRNFFFPAEAAMVQGILTEEDYAASAGLNQMISSLFMLFGGALGVFCYWTLGIEGAIIIDMISFAASGLLIRSCRIEEDVRLPNGRHTIGQLNTKMVWADFQSGFVYLFQNKLLLTLIAGFFLFGIVNGGFSVMEVFILKYKLEPQNYEKYSVITGAVFGTGVLLGSIFASAASKKLKLHHMLIFGLFFTGFITVFIGSAEQTWVYLLCLGLIALFLPFVNVSIGGWLPKIVDPKMMGRVQSCINPCMMLSQSLTLFLIAVFYPKYINIEVLFWVVGGCLAAAGLFYLLVLPLFMKETAVKEAAEGI